MGKRAAAGADIVIARKAKPVASLTRVRSTPLAPFKGKIHMAKDFDAIPP